MYLVEQSTGKPLAEDDVPYLHRELIKKREKGLWKMPVRFTTCKTVSTDEDYLKSLHIVKETKQVRAWEKARETNRKLADKIDAELREGDTYKDVAKRLHVPLTRISAVAYQAGIKVYRWQAKRHSDGVTFVADDLNQLATLTGIDQKQINSVYAREHSIQGFTIKKIAGGYPVANV